MLPRWIKLAVGLGVVVLSLLVWQALAHFNAVAHFVPDIYEGFTDIIL